MTDNSMIPQLSKEKELLFKKYACFYNLSIEDYENGIKTKENYNSWCRVALQKEVYSAILKTKDSSGIHRLIDTIETEIEKQYQRKGHIENRTGYLMAYWGIIVGCFLQNDWSIVRCKNDLYYVITAIFGLICFSCLLSLVLLCFCLMPLKLNAFSLANERSYHLRCSSQDPILFDVTVVETLINILENNECQIEKRSYLFKLTILCLAVSSALIFMELLLV